MKVLATVMCASFLFFSSCAMLKKGCCKKSECMSKEYKMKHGEKHHDKGEKKAKSSQ